MEKIIDIFEQQQTGPCKIQDWKLLYRKWNETWSISQYGEDYRIYKTPRVRMRSDRISMRTTISPEDAKEIIKTLDLVQVKSGIFSSGSVWRQASYYDKK